MALCPFAEKKLIAPGGNDPRIHVVGAILHVDAGDNFSLADYFRHRSGGIESHFHVRKDGVIEQYRDTAWEADANYKANSFYSGGVRKGFVSIETQGLGGGRWNPTQLRSIKRLLLWLSETHDFPLRECPGPFASGVGYHTLFGAPGPWTPVAKSCPGARRKKQFHNELVPWFAGAEQVKGEPMNVATMKKLAWHVFDKRIGGGDNRKPARKHLIWASNASRQGKNIARQNQKEIRQLEARQMRMENKIDSILEGMKSISPQVRQTVDGALTSFLDDNIEVDVSLKE